MVKQTPLQVLAYPVHCPTPLNITTLFAARYCMACQNFGLLDNCVCWINYKSYSTNVLVYIVSAHRRILGMAPVVCVLVKICVSRISFYKLDTDKLTTPFESAHQFTLVCTVSDSKTVPGCHYNLCSNHSFVLTD